MAKPFACPNRHVPNVIYPTLTLPPGKYFIQVSRFDPAKGITTLIDSYGQFRRLCEEQQIDERPQLVM